MIAERFPSVPLHDTILREGRPVALTGRCTHELRWRIRDDRVSVGRGTYGAPTIIMYTADDRVQIGNYCSLAGGCYLLPGGEHDTRATSTFPFSMYFDPKPSAEASNQQPLEIGSDVWIGLGAIVLSGVNVGHGAVIGACAVVAKDVPSYAIVVGNPARIIRYRFPDDVIAELLRIRWWDWHPERVAEYRALLEGDPRQFLDAVNRIPAEALAGYYGPPPATDVMDCIPLKTASRPLAIAKAVVRGLTPPVFVRLARRIYANGNEA